MILKLEDINKSYNSNKVLNQVNLSIPKGEVFALCGPSGSGKTTLINIIAGLTEFNSGLITIEKQTFNYNEKYPQNLYGKIGVIFQNHNLFPHLTVLENITLSLIKVKKFSKKEAIEIAKLELDKLGLLDKYNSYPAYLSGGELQRAAIARSLAMKPLFLLLDEPTSNLDPLRIDDILSTVEHLAEDNVTMMLITHNLDFAKSIGNNFGVIENGSIEISNDFNILNKLKGKYLKF